MPDSDLSLRRFNASLSLVPESPAALAASKGESILLHLAINETNLGDAKSFVELKAHYHGLTPESAKAAYDALQPLVGAQKDLTYDKVAELRKTVAAAIAAIDRYQVS